MMLAKTVIQDVSNTLHSGYDIIIAIGHRFVGWRRGGTNNTVNNNCGRVREQQLGDRDFPSVFIDLQMVHGGLYF